MHLLHLLRRITIVSISVMMLLAIATSSFVAHPLSSVALAATNEPVMSGPEHLFSSANGACASPTVDLKVLVIASDGNEADLPAIKQALAYVGVPYTVYTAAQTPNGLTPGILNSGCHGYYDGIIMTNGTVSYQHGSVWGSALSSQEWTTLSGYEATMGVRALSWYTYPSADFGYQPVTAAVDTSTNPLTTSLTTEGQAAFSYLNPKAVVTIQNAYTYLAKPLTDGTTIPLLSDVQGNALAAIHTYADKRQVLSLTFDTNPNLVHDIVLSYGLVNWVTQGLLLGERHVSMSAQFDDVFIEDSDWQATTSCAAPVDSTGATYRITGNDLKSLAKWQSSKRATSGILANTTFTMAFNGAGTVAGAYTPDTLTSVAKQKQSQFFWVSHTFDHTNLDAVSNTAATSEIVQNNQSASKLALKNYSSQAMVTPDVSGLTNPAFLQAAHDQGIRYLVTDTSIANYNNPTPNAGIYNPSQPDILQIPRHPTNLYYNVSTPAGWMAEYNCRYASYWGRNLSYQEILDKESQNMLTYLLKGDLDPWMFHQPNLRAYDGTHSLAGDLFDMTLQKYMQYYNLPIVNQQMNQLGAQVADWTQYVGAGVTASVTPGVSLKLTAQHAARVPITGLTSSTAEVYGGQHITYENLAAGQSITLPLEK